MGKVFTPIEVENGRVPQIDDFGRLIALATKEVVENDDIIAGLHLGSSFKGCHNRRSDLDIMIVYRDEKQASVMARLYELQLAAKKVYVPLEMILVPSDLVHSPFHSINPIFAAHLRGSAVCGGLIKGDPVGALYFDHDSSLRAYLVSYLQQRIDYLLKGQARLLIMSNEELCGYLSKILETPVHTMRKVLYIEGFLGHDDSRPEVIRVLREHHTLFSEEQVCLFQKLVAADQEYTTVLNAQLEQFRLNEYNDEIKRLVSMTSDCLRFMKQLALSIKL